MISDVYVIELRPLRLLRTLECDGDEVVIGTEQAEKADTFSTRERAQAYLDSKRKTDRLFLTAYAVGPRILLRRMDEEGFMFYEVA